MEKIQAHLLGNVVSSNSSEAFSLNSKSHFGERIGGKVQYSLLEALFLLESGKMDMFSKGKKIPGKEIEGKFQRFDKRIHIKYPVFRDLRKKGYVVKTALKFGADFRVYPKGMKPKEEHAKWIVFVDSESRKISWHEFSAKNRVAHSTKKSLLLAIVDEEEGITYYDVRWVRV